MFKKIFSKNPHIQNINVKAGGKTNSLSRVPPGTDLKLKVKEARNLITEVKQTQVEVKFTKLGKLEDLHLHVYADASFGSLD